MSLQPLSNEAALRIGLAAQMLPGVSIEELIEALERLSGGAIDLAALGRVTVAQLRSAFGQGFDLDGDEDAEPGSRDAEVAALKEAVRILWGESAGPAPVPEIEAEIEDGEPGPAIRVAVASNTGEFLDGHFGSCRRFLVYRVSAERIRLVDVRSTLLAERAPDRNAYRVGLVQDCRILYVVSAGGPAAAKVIKADIHLLQVPEGGAARDLLRRVQRVVAGTPPRWLARALAP